MAETVTLEDLSSQPAGQPALVSSSSLTMIHTTGLDTNGVTRERVTIYAWNSSTATRTLSVAVTGGTAQIVMTLRPQAGPILVAPDLILPASTLFTSREIAAQADGADVYVSGIVYQYKDVEIS
jgi:hypothetical protein